MTRKVWLGEQETPSSCGPACLKYALCVIGYSARESQLRRLARTTWRGTQTRRLMSAARRFGVNPTLRIFVHDQWSEARTWLSHELGEGRPVILDVEGFNHYVVAVQALGAHVVILDPEGSTKRGRDYARVVLSSERRLRSWWLSSEAAGEEASFRGISLAPPAAPPPKGMPRPTGPRLSFSAAALRRAMAGRPWLLDEYLIDAVEIAARARRSPGDPVPLADVVRRLGGEWLVGRVAYWYEVRPALIAMLKAHLEDIAVAAEAMSLTVPAEASSSVAVDVATLLGLMLAADD